MATEIGNVAAYDIIRSEDDTDDIVAIVKDSSGALVDTTSWTAVLSVGSDDNTALVPPKTYPGVGAGVSGVITIDMNGFDVPIGDYKYDIRMTAPGVDTPSRVYAKGKFKVKPRIN